MCVRWTKDAESCFSQKKEKGKFDLTNADTILKKSPWKRKRGAKATKWQLKASKQILVLPGKKENSWHFKILVQRQSFNTSSWIYSFLPILADDVNCRISFYFFHSKYPHSVLTSVQHYWLSIKISLAVKCSLWLNNPYMPKVINICMSWHITVLINWWLAWLKTWSLSHEANTGTMATTWLPSQPLH